MNISIKDKKIYIYVIGIVMGTILYNCINMDFSFYAQKVLWVDFFTYFIFEIIEGVKFLIVVYAISYFDRKKIFFYIVSFILSVMIGGAITLFIKYGNSHIFATAIDYLFKTLICGIIYERERNIKNIFISLLFIIVSGAFQNFLIKIF